MTIIEALKQAGDGAGLQNSGIRLSIGSRWMYWEHDLECWIVLERPPYARKNRMLTCTPDETEAVKHLVEEE